MSTPDARAEHTPLLASQLALIEAVRADVAALRAGGVPVPREAALDATANDLVGALLVGEVGLDVVVGDEPIVCLVEILAGLQRIFIILKRDTPQ